MKSLNPSIDIINREIKKDKIKVLIKNARLNGFKLTKKQIESFNYKPIAKSQYYGLFAKYENNKRVYGFS